MWYVASPPPHPPIMHSHIQIAYYISKHIWGVDFARHVCIYDNAPSHRKRAPNALSAYKMHKRARDARHKIRERQGPDDLTEAGQ
jgi:hypothetical protein